MLEAYYSKWFLFFTALFSFCNCHSWHGLKSGRWKALTGGDGLVDLTQTLCIQFQKMLFPSFSNTHMNIPDTILWDFDSIASWSGCRFISCTSKMQTPCSTTSQWCFIWVSSGDCGVHLYTVNSVGCSRNQFELSDMASYHQRMSILWLWHGQQLKKAVAFKRFSVSSIEPKVCQENTPHTTTVTNCWYKAFVFFDVKVWLSSECCTTNQDSSDQATLFFQFPVAQSWWAPVNYTV